MFQKIIGIISALAVVGVIVMVALSPRTPGLFPNALDFLKGVNQQVDTAPGPEEPVIETTPGFIEEGLPAVDSLSIETQNDTLIQN